MRYQIVTLGCPKNTTDSDRIARTLERQGHRAVERRVDADLVILNTCGFIDDAREESRQAAEILAAERQPDQQVIVTGCWSQIEREQVIEIDGIDASFGIEAWQEIAEHAGAVEAERDIPETSIGVGPSAYLKISDGCARPCTFCNIPGIKGRQFRSAQPDALVSEARELVVRGAREIVLVAQDSTAYGAEWGDANGLARLIERLAAESGADWLRLMYAYPGFVTPSLVEVMANTPQVCHYLDIPLQHGSPTVLRRMKRPHNMSMVRGNARSAAPRPCRISRSARRSSSGFPERRSRSSANCSTSRRKLSSIGPARSSTRRNRELRRRTMSEQIRGVDEATTSRGADGLAR